MLMDEEKNSEMGEGKPKLSPEQIELLENELDEKIPSYYDATSSIKLLEKTKDPLNARIKEIMATLGYKSCDIGDFVATRSIEERSSLNEAKLLVILRELGHEDAIETVERVNQEVFDKLVYDNIINPADFATCVDTTEIVKLSVKKKKAPKAPAGKKAKKEAIVNAVNDKDIY